MSRQNLQNEAHGTGLNSNGISGVSEASTQNAAQQEPKEPEDHTSAARKGKGKSRGRPRKGNRMSKAEEQARELYAPGQYPVLLGAEEADPSQRAFYAVDFAGNFDEVHRLYSLYHETAKFQEYFQSRTIVDGPGIDGFERDFMASAVLSQTQFIKWDGTADRVPMDGYELLDQELSHIESVWIHATQIGTATLDKIGYESKMKRPYREMQRGVRLAHRLLDANTDRDDRREFAQLSWLPVSNEDESFDVIIRCQVQRILEEQNIRYVSATPDLPILTNEEPDWWDGIPGATQLLLAPFFDVRPHNAQTWVRWANGIPGGSFGGNFLRPRPINEFDLQFNLQADALLPLVDRWARTVTVLQNTFIMSIGPRRAGGSVSTLQYHTRTQGGNVWTTRAYSNDIDDHSGLAMILPTHTWFLRRELSIPGIIYRTSADLNEVKAKWLESAIRHT